MSSTDTDTCRKSQKIQTEVEFSGQEPTTSAYQWTLDRATTLLCPRDTDP